MKKFNFYKVLATGQANISSSKNTKNRLGSRLRNG